MTDTHVSHVSARGHTIVHILACEWHARCLRRSADAEDAHSDCGCKSLLWFCVQYVCTSVRRHSAMRSLLANRSGDGGNVIANIDYIHMHHFRSSTARQKPKSHHARIRVCVWLRLQFNFELRRRFFSPAWSILFFSSLTMGRNSWLSVRPDVAHLSVWQRLHIMRTVAWHGVDAALMMTMMPSSYWDHKCVLWADYQRMSQ